MIMYSEWCSKCGRKMTKRFNGYTDVWFCEWCDSTATIMSQYDYGNGTSPYDVGR